MQERRVSSVLRRVWTTGLVGALTVLLVACEFTSTSERPPLAPTGVTVTPVLLGTWNFSSAAASTLVVPAADSCTELEFTFNAQEGDA